MSYELVSEGTRRLRLVLSSSAAAAILVAYIVLLTVYGRPYWPGWWIVMAAILVVAFLAGRALVPVFEWVIAGYRTDDRRA
jgi:hypothetical protein